MAGQYLFQFRHPGQDEPPLEEVVSRFGLDPTDVDDGYGVVKVADDPEGPLYVIRVNEAARRKLGSPAEQTRSDPGEGVFSDPPIEPFGPPEG